MDKMKAANEVVKDTKSSVTSLFDALRNNVEAANEIGRDYLDVIGSAETIDVLDGLNGYMSELSGKINNVVAYADSIGATGATSHEDLTQAVNYGAVSMLDATERARTNIHGMAPRAIGDGFSDFLSYTLFSRLKAALSKKGGVASGHSGGHSSGKGGAHSSAPVRLPEKVLAMFCRSVGRGTGKQMRNFVGSYTSKHSPDELCTALAFGSFGYELDISKGSTRGRGRADWLATLVECSGPGGFDDVVRVINDMRNFGDDHLSESRQALDRFFEVGDYLDDVLSDANRQLGDIDSAVEEANLSLARSKKDDKVHFDDGYPKLIGGRVSTLTEQLLSFTSELSDQAKVVFDSYGSVGPDGARVDDIAVMRGAVTRLVSLQMVLRDDGRGLGAKVSDLDGRRDAFDEFYRKLSHKLKTRLTDDLYLQMNKLFLTCGAIARAESATRNKNMLMLARLPQNVRDVMFDACDSVGAAVSRAMFDVWMGSTRKMVGRMDHQTVANEIQGLADLVDDDRLGPVMSDLKIVINRKMDEDRVLGPVMAIAEERKMLIEDGAKSLVECQNSAKMLR